LEKRKERIDRGIKARSQDIFALCSYREMLYLSAPRLIPILGFLILPLVIGVYWQKVLLSAVVFVLLAISWDILAESGMVSLGQALFFWNRGIYYGYPEPLFRISPLYFNSFGNNNGGIGMYLDVIACFKA